MLWAAWSPLGDRLLVALSTPYLAASELTSSLAVFRAKPGHLAAESRLAPLLPGPSDSLKGSGAQLVWPAGRTACSVVHTQLTCGQLALVERRLRAATPGRLGVRVPWASQAACCCHPSQSAPLGGMWRC